MRTLLRYIKKSLYFSVAAYFGLFARFFLFRWQPTIITITGSSGKTTLLHLFEAQLGEKAVYSHKANSAFGIPFHILGLERKSYGVSEWFVFFILAPFMVFRKVPKQKFYVTEADAERPGEGKFLAKLLKPHIVIWLSLEEAHGVQYDALVSKLKIKENNGHHHSTTAPEAVAAVKTVISREFSWFLQTARSLAVLNGDNNYIVRQAKKTNVQTIWLWADDVTSANARHDSVVFYTKFGDYNLPRLVPFTVGQSVMAVLKVMQYLDLPIDENFTAFTLPPGRSSVFHGKNKITIIDSTYNATMDGVKSMLGLFAEYPAPGEKWLVLGDMIEQGRSEPYEHTSLVPLIQEANPKRVVLVGPRLQQYTYPVLANAFPEDAVASFLLPGEAYDYLAKNLSSGETILFKGARFLEGIVEKLLDDPKDADKLCRREKIWVEKRKQWGI